MSISYAGIFMALVLIVLIVLVSIWIVVEKRRQRRYYRVLNKLKKVELRLIG